MVSAQKRKRKRLFSSHTLGTSCAVTIIVIIIFFLLSFVVSSHLPSLAMPHYRHQRKHTRYLAKGNRLRNLKEQQIAVTQVL
jgi:hypothetical protein